ncbi:MAG: hypothetical protein OEQ16_11160, partial [Gammaproteobacteria bacterium]|nr:hypothetical protein [Gammaproteobacteria bacterium]
NSLNLRRITKDGQLEPVHQVAEISQLRVVPQLVFRNDSLFLAWTDELDGTRHLRVVQVPVNAG